MKPEPLQSDKLAQMGMDNFWWAIISESTNDPTAQIATEPITGKNGSHSSHTLQERYLDPQKRYRFSDDGQSLINTHQGRVVDTQPMQQPFLEKQLDAIEELPEQAVEDDLTRLGLPAIALPYLTLQEFVPTIPEIYDAWSDETREVVLLADRSHCQLLSCLWAEEPLPALQMLHYLDEMVQLWQALVEVNCCQSLLEVTNLRVDEDQAIALQQLYPDPNTPATLTRLMQMWQTLLTQSSAGKGSGGCFEPAQADYQFLQPLWQAAHEVETPAQLRSQLQNLAQAYSQSADADGDPVSSGKSDDLPTVVLPMVLRSLDDAGATDVGRQRRQNEDSFSINTQVIKTETHQSRTVQARGLYLVCDGMGGHAGGEVASAMAVDTLQQYFHTHWGEQFPDEKTIQEGIWLANQSIYNVNRQDARTGSERMGTTLVMALVQNTQVAIASVGDSRLYRVTRKRGVEQISVDHCVGQQQVLRGVEPEIAYARPDAYQLTQALGPCDHSSVSPAIEIMNVSEDTLFLLCSDGLSDNRLVNTSAEHLLSLLSSKANLKQGLQKLIGFANQHNGHDNITGILVRVKLKPSLEPKR